MANWMGAGTLSGSEYRVASVWMGDQTEKVTFLVVGSSLPSQTLAGGANVGARVLLSSRVAEAAGRALGLEQVAASEAPANPAGAPKNHGTGGGVTAVLGGITLLSGEWQRNELQVNKSSC